MKSAIFEVKVEMINGEEHVLMDDANETEISMSELEEYAMELESYYEEEDLRHFSQVQDARMNRRMMQ